MKLWKKLAITAAPFAMMGAGFAMIELSTGMTGHTARVNTEAAGIVTLAASTIPFVVAIALLKRPEAPPQRRR